jgi:nitroreductase
MGVSTAKVVIISLFLILGMVLPGLLMQPKESLDAWDVKEGDFPSNGTPEERLAFLLNYAILAPSSYNSQPWKFNVSGDVIRIFADKSRWLQVADADQRELYISLGCALENLLVAEEHFGYSSHVTYFPENEDSVASIKLNPGVYSPHYQNTSIFQAILTRHTNTMPYERRPVSEGAIKALQNLSAEEGVHLYLTSDPGFKDKFRELVVSADQAEYSDVNYKSELGHWLGQGTMGPTGIQALIAQMDVVFLDVGPKQTRNDAELVNSTPVLGFLITEENNREAQVRAGQAFERLWLAATAINLSVQPMSQVLEIPKTKAKLTELLPEGHLQQVFRLGFSESIPEHTPRRPLEEVLAK